MIRTKNSFKKINKINYNTHFPALEIPPESTLLGETSQHIRALSICDVEL